MTRHPLFMALGAMLLTATPGHVFEITTARPDSNSGVVRGHITFDGGTAPAGVIQTDAVIYLVGDGLATTPRAGETSGVPELIQEDITFSPHVLPVVVGTDVRIHNSDAIMHNVHTRSRKNRPFNKSQLGAMTATVKFKRSEIVAVSCDVHSQMSAYIVVLDNSFFTKLGADGSFMISDVPAGNYQLVAWHERYGQVQADVEVTADGITTAQLNFSKTVHAAEGSGL